MVLRRVRAAALICIVACMGLSGCEVQDQFGELETLSSPESFSYHQELAGSVLAAGDGTPIVGAVAEIVSHPNSVYVGARRSTDGDGFFDFGDVRSGLARGQQAVIEVEGRAAGFVSQRVTVTVRPDCSGGVPASVGCRYIVRLELAAE